LGGVTRGSENLLWHLMRSGLLPSREKCIFESDKNRKTAVLAVISRKLFCVAFDRGIGVAGGDGKGMQRFGLLQTGWGLDSE